MARREVVGVLLILMLSVAETSSVFTAFKPNKRSYLGPNNSLLSKQRFRRGEPVGEECDPSSAFCSKFTVLQREHEFAYRFPKKPNGRGSVLVILFYTSDNEPITMSTKGIAQPAIFEGGEVLEYDYSQIMGNIAGTTAVKSLRVDPASFNFKDAFGGYADCSVNVFVDGPELELHQKPGLGGAAETLRKPVDYLNLRDWELSLASVGFKGTCDVTKAFIRLIEAARGNGIPEGKKVNMKLRVGLRLVGKLNLDPTEYTKATKYFKSLIDKQRVWKELSDKVYKHVDKVMQFEDDVLKKITPPCSNIEKCFDKLSPADKDTYRKMQKEGGELLKKMAEKDIAVDKARNALMDEARKKAREELVQKHGKSAAKQLSKEAREAALKKAERAVAEKMKDKGWDKMRKGAKNRLINKELIRELGEAHLKSLRDKGVKEVEEKLFTGLRGTIRSLGTKVVKKLGLQRVLLVAMRFLPLLNVIGLVWDIAEVCIMAYQVFYSISKGTFGESFGGGSGDHDGALGGSSEGQGAMMGQMDPACLKDDATKKACQKVIDLCKETEDPVLDAFCKRVRADKEEKEKDPCKNPPESMKQACLEASANVEALKQMTEEEIKESITKKMEEEGESPPPSGGEEATGDSASGGIGSPISISQVKEKLNPKVKKLLDKLIDMHGATELTAEHLVSLMDITIDELSEEKIKEIEDNMKCDAAAGEDCAADSAFVWMSRLLQDIADAKREAATRVRCLAEEKHGDCKPKDIPKCSDLKLSKPVECLDGTEEEEAGVGTEDEGSGGDEGTATSGGVAETAGSGGGDTGGQGTGNGDPNGSVTNDGVPLCVPHPAAPTSTATCMDRKACEAGGGVDARFLCKGANSNRCCFKGSHKQATSGVEMITQPSLCNKAGGTCMLASACSTCVEANLCPGPSHVKCCLWNKNKAKCPEQESGDEEFGGGEDDDANGSGGGNARLVNYDKNQKKIPSSGCLWKVPVCPRLLSFIRGGFLADDPVRAFPTCRSKIMQNLGTVETKNVNGEVVARFSVNDVFCSHSDKAGIRTFVLNFNLVSDPAVLKGEAKEWCAKAGLTKVCQGTTLFGGVLAVSDTAILSFKKKQFKQ